MNDQTPPSDWDDRSGPSEGAVRSAQRGQELLPPISASNLGGSLTVQSFGGVVMAQKVDRPRDLLAIEKEIQKLAAVYGEQFYYAWEVKEKATGKKSEVAGVTVDGASVLRQVWRNCMVETIVVKEEGEYIYLASRFVDYETGNTTIRPFKQRVRMKFGKMQNDRAMEIAFSIGVSKSERNVTLDALRIQKEQLFVAAKDNMREKIGKNLPKAKERLLQIAEQMSIPVDKLERYVERKQADWVVPHVVRLVQAIKAIQEGDATIDDVFGQEVTEGDLGEEKDKGQPDQGGQQQDQAGQKTDSKQETDKKPAAEKKTQAKKAEEKPAQESAQAAQQGQPAQQQAKQAEPAKAAQQKPAQQQQPIQDSIPQDSEPEPEPEQGGFGWLSGGGDADLGGED